MKIYTPENAKSDQEKIIDTIKKDKSFSSSEEDWWTGSNEPFVTSPLGFDINVFNSEFHDENDKYLKAAVYPLVEDESGNKTADLTLPILSFYTDRELNIVPSHKVSLRAVKDAVRDRLRIADATLVSTDEWGASVQKSNQIRRAEWEKLENNHRIHYSDNPINPKAACTNITMDVVGDTLTVACDALSKDDDILPVCNSGEGILLSTRHGIENAVKRTIGKYKDAIVKKFAVDEYRRSFDIKERLDEDVFGGLENIIYPSYSQFAGEKGSIFGDIGDDAEKCDYTGMEGNFVSAYADYLEAVMSELGHKYTKSTYPYTYFADTVMSCSEEVLEKDIAEYIKTNVESGVLSKNILVHSVADTLDIVPHDGNPNNLPENYTMGAKEYNIHEKLSQEVTKLGLNSSLCLSNELYGFDDDTVPESDPDYGKPMHTISIEGKLAINGEQSTNFSYIRKNVDPNELVNGAIETIRYLQSTNDKDLENTPSQNAKQSAPANNNPKIRR